MKTNIILIQSLFFLIIIFTCQSIGRASPSNEDNFDFLGKIVVNKILRNDEIDFALDMVKLKINPLLSRANLSVSCNQFRKLMENELQKGTFWPIQLLDAQAKIPFAFLRGKIQILGSYDQCMELDVDLAKYHAKFPALPDRLKGRYCHLKIPVQRILKRLPVDLLKNKRLESMELSNLRSLVTSSDSDLMDPDIHLCLPSACTNDDMESLIRVLKGAIQLERSLPTELGQCDDGQSRPLDSLEILILMIIGFLVWCVTFGTIMDWYHGKYKMKPRFKLIEVTIFFSIVRNGRRLLDTRESSNFITSLHGIKVLSMLFIFLGHLGLALMGSFAVDALELDKRAKEFWIQFVVNCSPWVDTFFLISGLLVSYHILERAGSHDTSELNDKSRLQQIVKTAKYLSNAYLYRYLRLAVPLAAVLLLTIIWNRMGSGPNWHLWNDGIAQTCKRDWWKILFFVNNFYDQNMIGMVCLGPTWYIANDFQFFLIAPFITMLILSRRRWLSWTILGLLTASSIIITGVIIHLKDLTPAIVWHPKMVNGYYTEVYTKPWCRIGAYCIGLGLGDILVLTKGNCKINKILNLSLWLISIATILAIILMPYRFNLYNFTKSEAILYGSLHRPIWALAWSWIVFSLATGNAGLMEKIFSWPFLTVLSRLTYAAYLLQYIIFSHMVISNRLYLNASTPLGAVLFFGNYTITYLCSVVLTLMVEYPCKTMLEAWQRSKLDSKGAGKTAKINGFHQQSGVKLTAVNKPIEVKLEKPIVA